MKEWTMVNKKAKNKIAPYLLLIFIATLFMGVGYSAMNSISLGIEGTTLSKVQEKVFITDAVYDTSTDYVVGSEIKNFEQSILKSQIVLSPESKDASITYTINLHNNSNSVYMFDGVKYTEEFYDNPNIIFDLNGLEIGDLIQPNGDLSFKITFSYKDNIIAANNILNSYLNFQFIDIDTIIANCDVDVTGGNTDIYNIDVNKLSATITNNNKYNIKGNITLNNKQVKTFDIASNETKSMSDLALTKAMVSGLSAGNQNLTVTITYPYNKTLKNVPFNLIGTITNVEKHGVVVGGTEKDPYIVYAIEDLVRLAQKVNSGGSTYSGKYIKQLKSVNFASASDYYNSADTTFGDLNGTSDGNKIITEMTTGTGFMGIGTSQTVSFQGTYLGNNKAISGLYINCKTTNARIGLFGYIQNATIKNLGIESGSITLIGDGGALVGALYGTCQINSCYNKASVTNTTAGYCVGGVVGTTMDNSIITVTDCYNTGIITCYDGVAGIVGFDLRSTSVTLERCYNTGTIKSTRPGEGYVSAAGLIIKDHSSSGTLTISQCYNSGSVSGYRRIGGLLAEAASTVKITDSYNIGNLSTTGGDNIGGIVGYQGTGNLTITNCYSTGTITGTATNKGGIIGYKGGTANLTNAYYLSTCGGTATNGGTAKTSTDMQASSFISLLSSNFKYNSGGYPRLQWQ